MNRLSQEKSPYLLQHATDPVDWYPWGPVAFAKARRENKPVFLSIGFSTCHWCHVMRRESFENLAIAVLLNERFVPILVDREERPDIDRIYLSAAEAAGWSSGWPLNLWLTPDRKPFFGGSYFPLKTNRQLEAEIGHSDWNSLRSYLDRADALAPEESIFYVPPRLVYPTPVAPTAVLDDDLSDLNYPTGSRDRVTIH